MSDLVSQAVAEKGVHTVVHDWDGTLVPSMWPEFPDHFLPGAVEQVKRLHAAGLRQVILSARLSPFDPFTMRERDKAFVATEVQKVRDLLDRHGLSFVDIWTLPGKPGGTVYVDDRAVRFTGNWQRTADKVLLYCGKEDAVFPAFDQAAAEESLRGSDR